MMCRVVIRGVVEHVCCYCSLAGYAVDDLHFLKWLILEVGINRYLQGSFLYLLEAP